MRSRLFRGRHALNYSGGMMCTAAVREIGGYVFDCWVEDWDLYLRLARVSQLRGLSQPVTVHRHHTDASNSRERRRVQLSIETGIPRDRSRAYLDSMPLWSVPHLRADRRPQSQVWHHMALAPHVCLGAWAALLMACLLDPPGSAECCWLDERDQMRVRRPPATAPANGRSRRHCADGRGADA